MQTKARQKDQESESSSVGDKRRLKDSGKKTQFGRLNECTARYKDQGRMTKCVAQCRVTEKHEKNQRRCKDHKGEIQG